MLNFARYTFVYDEILHRVNVIKSLKCYVPILNNVFQLTYHQPKYVRFNKTEQCR